MLNPSASSVAPPEAVAGAADVLKGCVPGDRTGNIKRLIDAGWMQDDAHRDETARNPKPYVES